MQYSNTARESFERFLADDNEENGAKPTAAGTLMRCSDALNCLRDKYARITPKLNIPCTWR